MKKIIAFVLAFIFLFSLVGCSGLNEETVIFNGQSFNKAELSGETLEWLKWYNGLTEAEQLAVDYIPAELLNFAKDLVDYKAVETLEPNEWGITLKAENVTAKGLTLVCNQSGGENVAELNTGSYYMIQKAGNGSWVDVEYLPQEYDISWTSEAYVIQKDGTTTWDVNWEWLYGELPAGEYRIGKEIMNFRGTGDFDKEMVYAEFKITANADIENSDISIPEDAYSLNAKVLKISKSSLLVEPSEDSNERRSSDKIEISLRDVEAPENLKVGDSVRITYDGMIQELYPAIIPNVYSVEKN